MPGSTQVPIRLLLAFAYGTLTLFGRLSHTFLLAQLCLLMGPTTPHFRAVWAAPLSLATTRGMLSFPLGT